MPMVRVTGGGTSFNGLTLYFGAGGSDTTYYYAIPTGGHSSITFKNESQTSGVTTTILSQDKSTTLASLDRQTSIVLDVSAYEYVLFKNRSYPQLISATYPS